MPDFVTLSCPSCGAKLQINADIEHFACSHCGNEHVVKRGGGITSLTPVLEQLKHVSTGVDKTASELAIKRLRDDIEEIQSNMPNLSNEGCLSKIAFGLATLGVLMALGGIFTGEASTIVLAIIVGVAFIAVSVWLGSVEDKRKDAILKPYRMQIAEKKRQMEAHEKIVFEN